MQVRSFAKETASTERYSGAQGQVLQWGLKSARASGFFFGFNSIIGTGSIVTVLWFGARQVGPALNTYNSFEHLCCFCCALANIITRLFQPDGARCIAAPCQLFTYNTERWIYGVAVQVVDGKLSAGQLSSFVIYALYVGTNVGALAGVISNLIQASSSNFRPAYFTLCLLFGRFWFCDK